MLSSIKSRSKILFLLLAFILWECAHERPPARLKPSALLLKEKEIAVPDELQAHDILQTARQYLGLRYRYGARGAGATDCSGFTQMVFRKHGVRLPRGADTQSQIGRYIGDKEELMPADLVFFQTYRRGPSHVGIYLGNNRFIHASTGKQKVVITSLNSSYYKKRYLGAKRVLHIIDEKPAQGFGAGSLLVK